MFGLVMALSVLGIGVDLGGLTTSAAVAAPVECRVTGGRVCSNRPPTARIEVTSQNGRTIGVCDRSADPENAIVSRRWGFGDGGTSSKECPKHTYARDGSYTVSLAVEDDAGQTDETSTRVTVKAGTSKATTNAGGGTSTTTSNAKPLPPEIIYRTRTVVVRESAAPRLTEDAHLERIATAPMVVTGSSSGLPVKATAGTVLMLLLVALWIVAKIRRRVSREVEGVDRMKEDILSNLSHELRTPLTPMMGFAEMLGHSRLSKEKTRTAAGAILDASVRLERVIDTLVDVAEIDAGKIVATRESVELGALCESLLAGWRARHPDATFTHTGEGSATVNGRLVTSALEQLVDNAVKFSDGPAEVSIDVTTDRAGARLTVTDRGVGIAAHERESIFRDFQQADGSATREHGGLGLGLSLVSRVAALHGGRVTVTSEPGAGSTFTLTLSAVGSRRRRRAA